MRKLVCVLGIELVPHSGASSLTTHATLRKVIPSLMCQLWLFHCTILWKIINSWIYVWGISCVTETRLRNKNIYNYQLTRILHFEGHIPHIHLCYKIFLVYEVILEAELVLDNGSLAQQRQNIPSVLLKDKGSEKGDFLTKDFQRRLEPHRSEQFLFWPKPRIISGTWSGRFPVRTFSGGDHWN